MSVTIRWSSEFSIFELCPTTHDYSHLLRYFTVSSSNQSQYSLTSSMKLQSDVFECNLGLTFPQIVSTSQLSYRLEQKSFRFYDWNINVSLLNTVLWTHYGLFDWIRVFIHSSCGSIAIDRPSKLWLIDVVIEMKFSPLPNKATNLVWFD